MFFCGRAKTRRREYRRGNSSRANQRHHNQHRDGQRLTGLQAPMLGRPDGSHDTLHMPARATRGNVDSSTHGHGRGGGRPSEPEAALLLIEDCLALTRAGAYGIFLGNALPLAGVIRDRNGDLPGALAALQEATLREHANGTRLYLGETLRVAAGMLARLGEAGQPWCCPVPLRPFPGGRLGRIHRRHVRKRADGDGKNPGSGPARARRGRLRRRAQPRRRDGRR